MVVAVVGGEVVGGAAVVVGAAVVGGAVGAGGGWVTTGAAGLPVVGAAGAKVPAGLAFGEEEGGGAVDEGDWSVLVGMEVEGA